MASKVQAQEVTQSRGRETVGVILLTLAAILLLSLLSYAPTDSSLNSHGAQNTHNLIGPVGAVLADLLLTGVGVAAYVIPGALMLVGGAILLDRRLRTRRGRIAALLGTLISGATMAHLVLGSRQLFSFPPGGILGLMTAELMQRWFSGTGSGILACSILILSLVYGVDLSVGSGLRGTIQMLHTLRRRLIVAWGVSRQRRQAVRQAREKERAEQARQRAELLARQVEEREDVDDEITVRAAAATEKALAKEARRAERRARREEAKLRGRMESTAPAAAEEPERPAITAEPDAAAALALDEPAWAQTEVLEIGEPAWAEEEAEAVALPVLSGPAAEELPPPPEDPEEGPAELVDEEAILEEEVTPRRASRRRQREEDVRIVACRDEEPDQSEAEEEAGEEPIAPPKSYVYPDISLLDYTEPEPVRLDRDRLLERARVLEQKLKDFKIDGRVVEIRQGPVVTMYEFKPGPGVKVAQIAGLSNDLAMAMEAVSVRIVAPIPGRSVVGIEIPNEKRETVFLKEIVADARFQKSRSKLTLAIGKNIEGQPYVTDLSKMPHLLIAGTTGSGKSVSVNTMILSMLYKATPDEVRLIMVDPKLLEFSIYEGIPHLLLPVVTDPKKAALALRWAVDEMERRYQLLSDMGVRDIAGYNQQAERLREEYNVQAAERIARAQAADAEGRELDEAELPAPPEKLQYIVIVIDELADLMMVAPRDIEAYIQRLAQKARAAGIHLLLATQRPSVDVVTGVIKANFPSRISFRVSSNHDSKTILNTTGAENLLGQGDMLILPPGTSTLERVHGAFVSEVEIKRVVNHLKAQGTPCYNESILQAADEEEDSAQGGQEEYDEMYDHAVRLVTETRKASISWLQRQLRVGYNRAARMIEVMEKEGIVGPASGAGGQREVLAREIEM